ncbi:MAG: hypothetical protein JWR61_5254 [Ferruginibacter sp.]|nr:hypothetical protein [Ferruginibacter sp.]
MVIIVVSLPCTFSALWYSSSICYSICFICNHFQKNGNSHGVKYKKTMFTFYREVASMELKTIRYLQSHT